MNLKAISILTMLLLGANISASAQTMEDALRFMTPNSYKSPREAALGTAFFGFSDDASGITSNPAGLTLIPAWELALGANLTARSTNSLFEGNPKNESNNEFYFSNVQMIIPSVVTENAPFNIRMGFSYTTDNDFTVNTTFGGFNPRSTFIANQAATQKEWTTHLGLANSDNFAIAIHDSLQQEGFVYEDGGLHNFAFGGAIDIGSMMSFGATLMIKSGSYEYSRNYFEMDIYNIYEVEPDNLTRLSVQEDLMQEIIGVSGVIGLQARINQYCRLGLAVKFPTMLSITEDYYSFYEADFDFAGEFDDYESWESPVFMQEYNVITPWEFSFGLSGNVAGLSYSVAASMQNAAGLYFDTDNRNLSYDDLQFFDGLNEQIEFELQTQYKFGLGLEYKVPEVPLYLRGSYSMQTSPYKDTDFGSDIHSIGGGLGLVISNNFILDAAVTYSSSNYLRANYGSMAEPSLASLYTVEQSVTSFLLGFKFRF